MVKATSGSCGVFLLCSRVIDDTTAWSWSGWLSGVQLLGWLDASRCWSIVRFLGLGPTAGFGPGFVPALFPGGRSTATTGFFVQIVGLFLKEEMVARG